MNDPQWKPFSALLYNLHHFFKNEFCHPLSSILIISWLNQKHIPSSKCILVKGCSCSAPRDGSPSSLSLLTISFSPLPIFAVSKSLLQLPTSLFWAILPYFHHHFCLDTLHTLSRNPRAIKAFARHGFICIESLSSRLSSHPHPPFHLCPSIPRCLGLRSHGSHQLLRHSDVLHLMKGDTGTLRYPGTQVL